MECEIKDELSSIEEWLREQNERARKKLRREVEASTPISAWHKLRSIPHLKEEV